MLISCITATTGRIELLRCIRSVYNQTYTNYQHLIIVDGEEHRTKVNGILNIFKNEGGSLDKINVVYLPYALKRYGGPIYSIGPTISKGDYIINLDDDNWIEPNHIESLLEAVNYNYHEWAYCLRNITVNGTFICQDNCVSLGYLHPLWHIPTEYHIDTSCIFLPRKIALEMAHFWSSNTENSYINDRIFYSNLKTKYSNYVCSMKHTVNYEVNTEIYDVNYYLNGNKEMEKKYGKQQHWIS